MHSLEIESNFYKGKASFDGFCTVQNEIINNNATEVELRLKLTQPFGLSFAFLIGCLPLMADSKGKILRTTLDHAIYTKLKRINIIDYYNYANNMSENLTKKPLKCFRKISNKTDIFTLVKEISDEAPIDMNEKLAGIFVSRLGEMYLNALEHSEAKYTIGAKFFNERKDKYCFCCYDTGIGIPSSVNKYRTSNGEIILSDVDAVKWALKQGHSTKQAIPNSFEATVPRGVGLSLLNSFAKANQGTIQICTGKALYIYDKNGEHYYYLDKEFMGTFFQMEIIADNDYTYILE